MLQCSQDHDRDLALSSLDGPCAFLSTIGETGNARAICSENAYPMIKKIFVEIFRFSCEQTVIDENQSKS